MKKVMIVDDNAVIAQAYSTKLASAGFEVATACDGLEAMKKIPTFKPDLVVLDLIMPRFTGADVLKFIRENPAFKSIRVIVFSNSFLSNLVEEVGGLEPDRALVKSDVNPGQLVGVINDLLDGKKTEPSAPKAEAKPSPKKAAASSPPDSAQQSKAASAAESDPLLRVGRDFMEKVATVVKELRKICDEFVGITEPSAADKLVEMNRRVSFLTQVAGMTGYPRTAKLCGAFEALLLDSIRKPEALTDSMRQTIVNTTVFLAAHFNRLGEEKEPRHALMNVLVVDDDAVSNRALTLALNRAEVAVVAMEDPIDGLKELNQKSYDAVLLDINMPRMNGFEFCEKMRELPLHKKTPVIFVTGESDFKARARSVLSGGDDLISKPISAIELCVKVVMRVLQR